jgi:hypothetical protein
MFMHHIFRCKPKKRVEYATLDDLKDLERRLLFIIGEGNPQKISELTEKLKQSANALRAAVENNQT